MRLAIMAGSAAAGPFEDGYAAATRQDYATALRLWTPMADQGDTNAQFNLGKMYAHGASVPKDDVLSVKWYRLAAEQGRRLRPEQPRSHVCQR
jgi:TPR repeat protein